MDTSVGVMSFYKAIIDGFYEKCGRLGMRDMIPLLAHSPTHLFWANHDCSWWRQADSNMPPMTDKR
ncbi:hypothetical protein MiSe_41540 [Microseira wollei NIES-4236]|uniref:Alpha-amylase n=1 Tax=Microseira wollei NIES-4236 TaxID=2530354 RepID=A0AAV3XGY0_9CYAN|nr:hypothetical protein MiSe_41540 [Microseira wollei NIES-4236]